MRSSKLTVLSEICSTNQPSNISSVAIKLIFLSRFRKLTRLFITTSRWLLTSWNMHSIRGMSSDFCLRTCSGSIRALSSKNWLSSGRIIWLSSGGFANTFVLKISRVYRMSLVLWSKCILIIRRSWKVLFRWETSRFASLKFTTRLDLKR